MPVPDVVVLLECRLPGWEIEVSLYGLARGDAYWSRRCRGVASRLSPALLLSAFVADKSSSGPSPSSSGSGEEAVNLNLFRGTAVDIGGLRGR